VDVKKSASTRITPRQMLISGLVGLSCVLSSVGMANASDLRADALLQIDLNRGTVVDKIISNWAGEINISEQAAFRIALSGLRADRLLAASLAGNYEGALEAILGRTSNGANANLAAQTISKVSPPVGSARASHSFEDLAALSLDTSIQDGSKAVGDTNLVYTPVTPCRLHDTRVGQTSALDPLFKTPMPQQTTRKIPAGGKCGIPTTGVKALFFSFHSYNYNPSALGVIAFQQSGGPASGLAGTWTGGVWAVGTVISQTLDDGAFDVFVGNNNPMSAEMVIDVQGYFSAMPSTSTTGLTITQNIVNNQTYSTVVLGSTFNTASGLGASVLGGGKPGADCTNPLTSVADYACWNRAAGNYATVAGGFANYSNAFSASIFGGQTNTVGTIPPSTEVADNGTIVGGQFNIVSQQDATIVGGRGNRSSGFFSVVVGGSGNTASGINAVAIGGSKNNAAGDASFAGGTRAFTKASAVATTGHQGAFVWADTTNADFFSTANNEFAVRASGGYRLISGAGGCTLPAGGATSWSCTSDRNAKEAFTSINPKDILSKVVALPLTTWQYKGVSRRHLYPMAQDFWAAFGLGLDDKSIGSGDVGGVALAAVQGVNQKLNEEASALKNQNAKLQKELAIIKKKLGL
jgi:hypothetical protein